MQQRERVAVDIAVKQKVPYFSQWETPDMTLAVVAEGAQTALLKDPLWASSGARNVEDYARWAGNLCGMACLKMVLAARTGRTMPIIDLAMGCKDYGGYVEEADGRIKGLIYAPFVPFVKDRFGLDAKVVTGFLSEISAISWRNRNSSLRPCTIPSAGPIPSRHRRADISCW